MALATEAVLTPPERMTLLRRIAGTHLEEGDCAAAVDALNTAVSVARETEDLSRMAAALNMMGIVEKRQGNLTEGVSLLDQARVLAVAVEDLQTLSRIDQNLGTIANIRGNYSGALEHYQIVP
jgi:hypothetical protein